MLLHILVEHTSNMFETAYYINLLYLRTICIYEFHAILAR